MAGLDARLYAITSDGGFWRRTAEENVAWDRLGDAPDGAAALAAMEGRLLAVTDAGALDELGEREALEELAHFLRDADPDLLEDAVALAVVVLAHHRRERSFDGGDDLGQRDVLGRPGEHVPAADAPLRPDQARALHGEENLLQVRLGRLVRSAISFTEVGRSLPCSASDRRARAA